MVSSFFIYIPAHSNLLTTIVEWRLSERAETAPNRPFWAPICAHVGLHRHLPRGKVSPRRCSQRVVMPGRATAAKVNNGIRPSTVNHSLPRPRRIPDIAIYYSILWIKNSALGNGACASVGTSRLRRGKYKVAAAAWRQSALCREARGGGQEGTV